MAYPEAVTCFPVPAPWTAAPFWQYSFSCGIAGLDGCDLDEFLGSMSDLQAFVGATWDGGTPHVDAGKPSVDSGKPRADSGKEHVDAGKPPVDSGKEHVDSGKTTASDGGKEVNHSDATVAQGDAGASAAGTTTGCSCRTASRGSARDPGGLAGLLLAGLALMRRRR